MTQLQDLNEYKAILKTIPDVLNEFFIDCSIGDAEGAMAAHNHNDVAALYPLIKCLSYELAFFYDYKFDNYSANDDKAAVVYMLHDEIMSQMTNDSRFATIMPLVDFGDVASIAKFKDYYDFAGSLAADDSQRVFVWLEGLNKTTLLEVEKKLSNSRLDLLNYIEDSKVVNEMISKLPNSYKLNKKVDDLNYAILDSCMDCLKNGFCITNEDMVDKMYARLHPKLPLVSAHKMRSLIHNSVPVVRGIITQKDVQINDLEYMQEEFMLLHKNQPKFGGYDYLKRQIFKQRLKDNPYQGVDFAAALNLQDLNISLTEILTVDQVAQADYIEQFREAYNADEFWNKYETSKIATEDAVFKVAMQDLLKNALAGFVKAMGKSSTSMLDHYRNDALSVVGDMEKNAVDMQKIHGVINFCRDVFVINEGMDKYWGCQIASQEISRELLEYLANKQELAVADFVAPSNYLKSIYARGAEIRSVLVSRTKVPEGYSLIEQIKHLPESLEKFETSELFYRANKLMMPRVEVMEKYCQDLALQHIQGFHPEDHKLMLDNLELMSQAYPQVAKVDITKVADEIDLNVCQAYLLPLYRGREIIDTDVEQNIGSTSGFDGGARAAVTEVAKLFIDRVLDVHSELLEKPQKCRVIFEPLKVLDNFEIFADDLQENIDESFLMLQKQSILFNKYQRRNHAISEIENTPDLNWQLINQRRFSHS